MNILPSLDELFSGKVKKFSGNIIHSDVGFFERYSLNSGDMVVPEYQRKDVWTIEQKQNLIRSIFYGISVPPVILNSRKRKSDTDYETEFIRYIVDGGQRIRTINQFINNDFEVDGFFWNTLQEGPKSHFLRRPFQYINTHFDTEEIEKQYYILFNTSGAIHSQEDLNILNTK